VGAAVTTAVRTEIALLRKDLEQTRVDLASKIDANAALLRSELESSTTLLRHQLEASTALPRNEFEARLQAMAKELVKWFAGIMLAHGIAVIGVTVTLVKLL
jgi:class 3 adenylate cyclase